MVDNASSSLWDSVRAAAQFKTDSANVAAPERVAAVLKTRREWAEAAGLSGDVIEGLYRDLVAYSVSEEHKEWERLNHPQNPAQNH